MYYENEEGYLKLLKDTLEEGEEIETRNGKTISKFCNLLKFENIENLPLLTTKKIYYKGVIEELLWFLQGSVDANILKDKKVNIWNGNSSREYLDNNGFTDYKEGELGPIYGWQWRKFGKKYKKEGDKEGVDQIKYVIEELSKPNNSRRAVLSGWNPLQLSEMALPPCHILYTFYKNKQGLSCLMTLRSSDLFLGLPFNIASTAILTHIIAKVIKINVNSIGIAISDGHIYEEHKEAVNIQIKRNIYENKIKLKIESENNIGETIEEKIKWINNLKYEDFKIENYKYHEKINAEMK